MSDALIDDLSNLAGDVASAAIGVPRNGAINELVRYVLGGAIGTLSKPDPRGYIRAVTSAGSTEWIPFGPRSDSFRVDIGFELVDAPLDSSLRIIIEMEDEDISNHDTIGTIELRRDQIIDALNEDQVVWIPTIRGGNALATGVIAVQLSATLSR